MSLPNYLSNSQKAEIEHAIKNGIPIIISGKQGPTGKTTLKNLLTECGAIAFEEWECQKIVLNERIVPNEKSNV